jgi:hypothetical protein
MNFANECLDKIKIDLTSRKIELYGTDGSHEVITDNSVGQFMSMLDLIKKTAPADIVEYATL